MNARAEKHIIITRTIIENANTSGNSFLLKTDLLAFLDFFAIYKLMHIE